MTKKERETHAALALLTHSIAFLAGGITSGIAGFLCTWIVELLKR